MIAKKVKAQKKMIARAEKNNCLRKEDKNESTFGKVEYRPMREFQEDVMNER